MTDDCKPIHPHDVPDEDIAWLRKQNAELLVEIIGQLFLASCSSRPLLHESILRAHRNRLRAAEAAAYRKVQAIGVPPLNIPEPERSAAWARMDRADAAWKQASKALDASWYLKPGFHRGVKP